MAFSSLISSVAACRLCAGDISEPIRPVVQVGSAARVLIAGQAPGRNAQASGVPFDDARSERLLDWMGIARATFHNAGRIAILAMAFCYPGKRKSGDLPPPAICAATWRARLLAAIPDIALALAIGQYAQRWHIASPHKNLTETVRCWSDQSANIIPLPHPSPRNNIRLKKNPWFSEQLLPDLKARVAKALAA